MLDKEVTFQDVMISHHSTHNHIQLEMKLHVRGTRYVHIWESLTTTLLPLR